MDKKLLVSLMMTAPVAAYAQSGLTVSLGDKTMDVNIPATVGNWLPDNVGNTGSQNNVQVKNGLVMSTLSNSTLTLAFASANFAPGQYVLNFGDPTKNLVNAEVKLNGTTIYGWDSVNKKYTVFETYPLSTDKTGATLDNDGNLVYDSTIDARLKDAEGVMSALTIVAVKNNNADFGIGDVKMTLNYDMKQAVSDVVAAYDKIDNAGGWNLEWVNTSKNDDGVYTGYIASLQTAAAAAVKEYNRLDNDLYGVGTPDTFKEKIDILRNGIAPKASQAALDLLWNAYISYGFSSYVPSPTAEVLPLVTAEDNAVKAYNVQAKDLNAKQSNYNLNESRFTNLKTKVQNLRYNYATAAKKAETNPGTLPGLTYPDLTKDDPKYAEKAAQNAKDQALIDFCKFAMSESVSSINNEIDAWDAAINVAFAQDNLTKYIAPSVNPATGEPDVEFVDQYGTLNTEINNLGLGYYGAKRDWTAFGQFQKVAQIVYDFYLTDWAGVSENLYKGKETDYTNLCYQYQRKLQSIYKDNLDYLITPGVNDKGVAYTWANALQPDNAAIIGAYGKLGADETYEPTPDDINTYDPNNTTVSALNQAKKRVYEMGGLPEQLAKQVARNEANHKKADAKIADLEKEQDAFDAVANGDLMNGLDAKLSTEYAAEGTTDARKEAILDQKKAIADAQKAYTAVANAISALDELYNKQYNDYILVDPTTDPVVNAGEDQTEAKAAEAVAKAQKDVEDAIAAYNTSIEKIGLGQTFDLLNKLEQKYAKIKIDTSVAAVASYDLASLFQDSYDNIYASIETLSTDPSNTALAGQIDQAIKDFGGTTCDNLVAAFTKASKQLTLISNELTAFDNAALPTLKGKANKWYYGTSMDEQLAAFKFTGWKENGKDVKLSREEMGERVDALKTQVENAVAGTPQDAIKAANKFVSDINGTFKSSGAAASNVWYERIAAGEVSYAQQVTIVNQKNAAAYCKDLKTVLDGAVTAGAPGLPANFNPAVAPYSAAYPAYTSVDENEIKAQTTVADVTTLDVVLKYYVDEYTKKYNEVKKAADNYRAYSDLNKDLPKIGLGTYDTKVEQTTVEPAVSYFKGLKAGFQATYDAIEKDIKDSYNDMTEVADQAGYQSRINSLKSEVSEALKRCAANDAAYQALAIDNADIVALANSVSAYVQAHDELADHKAAVLKEIKEITDEAAKTDNAVRNDFAKGLCGTNQNTYKTKYAELLKKLQDIDAQWEGKYREAVKEANNTYIEENGLSGLAQKYQDIVNAVNDYRDKYGDGATVYYQMLLDNDDYRTYHHELQAQYSLIMGNQGYDARFNAFNNTLTSSDDSDNWVILSQLAPVDEATGELLPPAQNLTPAELADYNKLAGFMKESGEINKAMTDAYAGINTLGEQTAVSYMQDYAFANPDGAVTKMNDVRSILEDPVNGYGFLPDSADVYNPVTKENEKQYDGEASQRYLDEFTEIDAAVVSYRTLMFDVQATPDQGEERLDAQHDLIMGMYSISETVDEIYGNGMDTDAMVKTAVLDQWTSVYNESLENIDKWINALLPNVDEDDVLSSVAADVLNLQDIKAEIEKRGVEWANLKTEANKTNPAKFKNLYNNPDPAHLGLRLLYEQAQKVYGDYEKGIVSDKVYNDLVADTKSPAQEIQRLINALIADYGFGTAIDSYQTDLDKIVNNITLKQYAGTLTDKELKAAGKNEPKTFTDNFNDLKAKIVADGAKKAFADAQTYISTNLVNLAKASLNTAKVENKVTDAQFKTISDKINKLQSDALALVFNAQDPAKSVTDIQNAKKALVDLIVELDDKGGKYDSTEDAIAVLNVRADKILGQLNAFKNKVNTTGAKQKEYGEAVINEFVPQVDELIAQLEEIQENYNGAGDAVIGQVDDYTFRLNRVAYELTHSYQGSTIGLEAAWSQANDKATRYYNSDVVADALLASLDTMESQLNFAHDAILEYNKNAKGEGVDPDQDVYAALIKKIGGADGNGGYKAIVNNKKVRHSYVSTDDKNEYNKILSADVENYVKPTLVEAFQKACGAADDKIDYLIAVVLGQKPESKNDNGWTYSYPDEASLIETLLAQHKKVAALLAQYDLINQTPNANGTFSNNTSKVAIQKYQGLIEELDAVNSESQTIYDEAKAEGFILGDVAGNDGKITIADVQTLINWVGSNKSLTDGEKKLADVTGDGVINIGDVTALINIMMEQGMPNKPNLSDFKKVRAFTGGSNSIAVEEIEGENGLRRFAVTLFNETPFAAGQIDINLPAGASVAAVTLGERAEGLESFVFENSGFTRILLTSLDNTMIEGNNGSILYIDVEGNAEIALENVIFSDANGKTYDLSNNGSGVTGIYDSIKNGVKAIYNAAGQKLNNLTKGINIIRNADGTTTKKVGK